jgi:hypothetical protein
MQQIRARAVGISFTTVPPEVHWHTHSAGDVGFGFGQPASAPFVDRFRGVGWKFSHAPVRGRSMFWSQATEMLPVMVPCADERQ